MVNCCEFLMAFYLLQFQIQLVARGCQLRGVCLFEDAARAHPEAGDVQGQDRQDVQDRDQRLRSMVRSKYLQSKIKINKRSRSWLLSTVGTSLPEAGAEGGHVEGHEAEAGVAREPLLLVQFADGPGPRNINILCPGRGRNMGNFTGAKKFRKTAMPTGGNKGCENLCFYSGNT